MRKNTKQRKTLKLLPLKTLKKTINELSKKDKTFDEKASKSFADFIVGNKGVKDEKMTSLYYQAAKKGKKFVDEKAIDKSVSEKYGKRYTTLDKTKKVILLKYIQMLGVNILSHTIYVKNT